ncbi:MAG TPA: hypothetical protein VII75_01125 [Thermoanaerobaculia bacterium]|nr:hypothetical protein [Thermoanaerobaculia bacterium]
MSLGAWLVVLSMSTQWRATDGSIDMREHYEAKDERADIQYRLTSILRITATEDRDTTVVLIEDVTAKDRLIVTMTSDYLRHLQSTEVKLLDTNETLTVSYPTNWKSNTRSGVFEEFHALPNPAQIHVHFTVNMNGVEESAADADWQKPEIAKKKSALWRAASARFLDALHRLRAIASEDGPLPTLCSGVLSVVLYDSSCPSGPAVKPVLPDCEFDASFRYHCSQQSLERAKNAKPESPVY